MPMIALIRVVLPDPFDPTMVTISPFEISRDASQSTLISPYWAEIRSTFSILSYLSLFGAPFGAEIRLNHSLVLRDLIGGPLGDQLAEIEDENPVGKPHHRLHYMLDHYRDFDQQKMRDDALERFSYRVVGKQYYDLYQDVIRS